MSAIRTLEAAAAGHRELVERLARLVNDVYVAAESGMWQAGATRTTPEEVAGLITAGELVVATDGGAIAGLVRLHDVSADTSEFGLLVSDPGRRNTGVGRALLDHAEEVTRARGLRTMQLELLVPREWVHPSKEFLKGWYGRRGYRLARTGTLEAAYPHLAPMLATPCDLEVHAKPLRPAQ